MSNYAVGAQNELDLKFYIEAYGVKVRIESNDAELLEDAREVVRATFAGQARFIEITNAETPHYFGLIRTADGSVHLYQNGEYLGSDELPILYRFFNGRLRVTVGEHSKSHVFVHAGTVGWKGKAIVMPADSFKGKTTLVAELIRNGADYYSDEYAVLDADGLVHPFPRGLSLRDQDGMYLEWNVPPDRLGAAAGEKPIPIGLVLFTSFEMGARWKPEMLSTGQGVLEVVPHIIPLRANPEFAMAVLTKAVGRAVVVKSPRSEAAEFAEILLSYFESLNS